MDQKSLTVLPSRPVAGEGTYSICGPCPAHKNCCTRVHRGGSIDLPVLLPDDVSQIEAATGLPSSEFSSSEPSNTGIPIRRMETAENGCFFYRDGRCSIYDVRPIDCRLFPFDIEEQPDGRLFWVAYTDLCPVEHDPRAYFEHVRPLLGPLRKHIRAFARVLAPGMKQQARIVLGEVEVSPSPP